MLKTPDSDSPRSPQSTASQPSPHATASLLNALPLPVFYLDGSGALCGWNNAFQHLFIGFNNGKDKAPSMADVQGAMPPDLMDWLVEKDTDQQKKPHGQRYEGLIQCIDGQSRRFSVHKSAVQDTNGAITGLAGLMLDITSVGDAGPCPPDPESLAARHAASLADLNIQLSEEIHRRRQAEKALRDSEDRYRTIFENTGTATILFEKDMTITMANAKTEKMAGIPREKFIGHSNAMDFVTSQHRDRLMMYHELRIKGDPNVPQQFEFQIHDINGNVRDILANVQWIPDTMQTVASLLDITEKNQLQKERQRLAAVIDQSAEAVIVTDKQGRIEYTNQAFADLSGYDRKESIGQTLEDGIFCEEDRQILKQMTFMVSGKDSWNGRFENQRRDGRTYIADTRIYPICDDRGNAINLVCVKTDVTHEVQLEKQLQQAQKMEAIGTLAGGIAHDFNNILGGILGYAEISMLKVAGDGQLKQNLDRILDGCHRAKELVQNILTFSRKSDEEIKPIEIQVIVKEALKLLRASIPSTIEFKQQIGTEPCIVNATTTQVHQVIMNLCTNASQAMQSSGGLLEVILENVELSSEQCEGQPNLSPGAYCRLAVCDTGQGMDTKVISRIFEPYYTTKEQTGGTGLGLSVVHGIVKNFGGVIAVESRPGQGTTFEIFLPRIENVMDIDAPEPVSLPSGKERVLVADDEFFILEIMTDMLGTLGYEVETANGGLEAMEIFSAAPDKFDIVIADLTMPKLTGTQLAMKIKQLRSDIPIILTTGMTYDMDKQEGRFKEFTAVLNKPILYQELAQTLRKVLDKHQ